MFSWFTRWRQRRRLRQRLLFTYWNGEQARHADPFLILRKLLAWKEGTLPETFEAAMEAREPAATEALRAIAEIFNVKPWDEATQTGLAGWEMLRLVREFETFLDAVKKNGSPGPSLSPPTDSESSTSPAGPAESQTQPSDST